MIAKKYNHIQQNTKPFIYTYGQNFKFIEKEAFGHKIEDENFYDCTKLNSLEFYKLIRNMDALTFGDQGMAMEGWTYFDCSAMPGAIVGMGVEVQNLDEKFKLKMNIPKDYTGLVPISMFITIPMMNGDWFGHNLCSLSSTLNDYKGLGLYTKAFGISVLKVKEMYGATQWGSHAINIHARLADMKLITSHTPVHTHEFSLCYKSVYTEENLLNALDESNKEEEYDFLIGTNETKKLKVLQEKIESGEEYLICGKPLYKDNSIFYKIRSIK